MIRRISLLPAWWFVISVVLESSSRQHLSYHAGIVGEQTQQDMLGL